MSKAEGIAIKHNLHENPTKSRIISAMQDYHQSRLSELREKVEATMGERDAAYLRQYILNLIDDMEP